MSNQIKNYLAIVLMAVLLMLGYAALDFAKTYSRAIQPSSFRSFTVSAEGQSLNLPDVAKFNFGVKTEGGKDIGDLQNKNTEKINSAIELLKSNGVKKEDIKTLNYNIEPRYQYYNCSIYQFNNCSENKDCVCPPPEIVGYTINQTIEVKIKDFPKIGGILSGIVKQGINEISNLSFEIDDPTAAQNAARDQAIAKAREKAESIAKAAGFRLGRLLSIEENNGAIPYYKSLRAETFGAEMSAVPAIEPGSQETNISISLTYEIE